jgi:hypothetical protein
VAASTRSPLPIRTGARKPPTRRRACGPRLRRGRRDARPDHRISGQEGSYLAELLLEKGYDVHGLVRGSTDRRFERLESIADRLALYPGDLLDESSLIDVLRKTRPDEVYNLAAMSSVADSWQLSVATAEYTAVGVTRLLEGIQEACPEARFSSPTPPRRIASSAGRPGRASISSSR